MNPDTGLVGGSEIAETVLSKLTGRVVNEIGEVLPGARVQLVLDSFALRASEGVPVNLLAPDPAAITDVEGNFELGVQPVQALTGRANLRVRASGYADWNRDVPLLGEDTDVGEIRLVHAARFEGILVDRDGEALPRERLAIWPEENWPDLGWPGESVLASLSSPRRREELVTRHVETGADGSFAVPNAGAWLIAAREPVEAVLVFEPTSEGVTTLVLPRGQSMSGRVQDPAGVPLAGAEVRLLARAGSEQVYLGRSLVSDATGGFRVEVQGGWSALGFSAPGFSQQVVPIRTEGVTSELLVTLTPRALFELQVLTSSDEPCGDAELDLFERVGFDLGSAQRTLDLRRGVVKQSTGPGEFLIELPVPGAFQANVRAPGRATAWDVELDATRTEPLIVRLENEALVHGQALDGLTGEPKAEVGVWVEGVDGPAPENAVISDESGRFEIGQLGAGHYRLHALDGAEAAYTSEEFELLPGERRQHDAQLSVGATVRGWVEAQNPEIAAPWRIVLAPIGEEDADARGPSQRGPETLTDGEGRFELLNVTAGAWFVEVHPLSPSRNEAPSGKSIAEFFVRRPPPLARELIRLAPGDDVQLRLSVGLSDSEACRIQGFLLGMVIDGGFKYRVEHRFEDETNSAWADGTGYFDLGFVPAGMGQLAVFAEWPSSLYHGIHSQLVKLEPGGDEVLTIELPGHGGVLFEVVSADAGTSLPGARIQYGSISEPGWGGILSPGLEPSIARAGTYLAICSAEGFTSAAQRFELESEGSVVTVHFELEAADPRTVLLSDAKGNPLSGGQVVLRTFGEERLPLGMPVGYFVGKDGHLDASSLPPAVYPVLLLMPSGKQVELELDFTQASREIRIEVP